MAFTWLDKLTTAIEAIDDEETQNELIVALVRYGALGEEPENLSQLPRLAFAILRSDVDYSVQAHANGAKGGRPAEKTQAPAPAAAKEPEPESAAVVENSPEPDAVQADAAVQKYPESAQAVSTLYNPPTEGVPNLKVRVRVKDEERECAQDAPRTPDVENSQGSRKQQAKRFTPPTAEEVRAYGQESGYSVDPSTFIAYYDSNGWKVGGRSQMRDWKAAVRTWWFRDHPGQSPKPKQTAAPKRRTAEEEYRDFLAAHPDAEELSAWAIG